MWIAVAAVESAKRIVAGQYKLHGWFWLGCFRGLIESDLVGFGEPSGTH